MNAVRHPPASESLPPAERLLRLVLPLHEAPRDPSAWRIALAGTAELLGCAQLGLVERDGEAVADVISFGSASDPRFLDEYRRDFVGLDPLADDRVQSRMMASAEPLMIGQLVDLDAYRRSAFFNEYWRRYGIADGVVAARLVSGNRLASFCALVGPGEELDGERRRLFGHFVDHCTAALAQRQALRLGERAMTGLSEATDALADGLVLLDEHGLVLEANAGARELLERGDPIQLHKGRLRAPRANGGDAIPELIRHASFGLEQAHCLSLRDAAGVVHQVTAVRLGEREVQRGAPVIALFIRSGGQSTKRFHPDQLRELFGFTPAETRIANALLAGEDVASIATRLAVRADTVRGHVKRMLAKTGARRQSELVARLHGAVPMLRAMTTRADD